MHPIPRLRTANIVDTGLASGLLNHARDRHLLALAGSGRLDRTLRFYRNTPTASIGCHQALARELRLDYCHRHGIGVARRVSGGGALYLDPGQLGFSLISGESGEGRRAPIAETLRQAAAAVAAGLRTLGIAARVKPPNDVEVGGRKIASVFMARHGRALLIQGIVLLETDVKTMLEVLRVPTEKLSPGGLAATRERLTTVAACAGAAPAWETIKSALMTGMGVEMGPQPGRGDSAGAPWSISPQQLDAENGMAMRLVWDGGDGDFVESLVRTPAATLRARAQFSAHEPLLRRIEFATDAHVAPAGFFSGLQNALTALPLALAADAVRHFASRHAAQTVGVTGADIVRLLQQLADKHRLVQNHRFSMREVNALMPCFDNAAPDTAAVLGKATVMLVPYCAKPAWCKWRHRDGCSECGKCEVGDAYRIARERGMQVTTIINYEHLVDTLTSLKAGKVAAYVGMCCGNFFIKRYRAFAEAGIPAVLMDISGANCYELKQEELAYAGRFEAEARLDGKLLERIARMIPPAGAGAAGDPERKAG
ncbi:MAG TPA: DUF116 domain-containing protein [Burkholderiales bacterium]|nr:DUF116 domain-containing protein [Burkholderiales bacterium]